MNKRDVVIIGGSLAGAACARELVRRGIDAVALERDRFPRRKVCGGFLSPGSVECAGRLGLLDEVIKAGAVTVRSARVCTQGRETEIVFKRPGLGISRDALDEIVARGSMVEEGHMVREVRRSQNGFVVDDIHCSAVIDASGKLGRFTKRRGAEEFGIQYVEPDSRGSVLEFSFFKDGYGGSVTIEGGRSNSCFLIKKEALSKYLAHPDCLVTGPLAYDRLPGDYIAIGDAAGMLDPFCGEGMRHALETGILAAAVVAAGLRRQTSYDEMKWEYESKWERRWAWKRAIGAGLRQLRFASMLRFAPSWLLNRMWD
jgi:flavin-dependent dehydrogenase